MTFWVLWCRLSNSWLGEVFNACVRCIAETQFSAMRHLHWTTKLHPVNSDQPRLLVILKQEIEKSEGFWDWYCEVKTLWQVASVEGQIYYGWFRKWRILKVYQTGKLAHETSNLQWSWPCCISIFLSEWHVLSYNKKWVCFWAPDYQQVYLFVWPAQTVIHQVCKDIVVGNEKMLKLKMFCFHSRKNCYR